MSRRILAVILAVTAAAMAAFGVPLGVAVARLYRDQEVLRLEREATLASAGVSASSLSGPDPVELVSPTGPTMIALYDVSGQRLLGQGPDRADAPVRNAMGGGLSDGASAGTIVVAVPLSHDEAVFAVVRAAVADSVVASRVRRAWLAMVATASVVLVAAAIAARWQAQRLTRPVQSLARATTRLGEGDFA
ncbi:MAG: hypothetical protein M3Y04_03950, partial [Actinomycetota bacterium]|nr:hypothetical protein [Actinomycetota bacterium]